MKFRLGIRFYLAMGLSLFILLILGAGTYFWYSYEEQVAERGLRTELEERAQLMATLSQVDIFSSQRAPMPASVAALDGNLIITYVLNDQRIVPMSGTPLDPYQTGLIRELSGEALQGQVVSREVSVQTRGEVETLYAAAPVLDNTGQVVGAVCLILPLDNFEATMHRSRARLLGTAVGIAVLSFLVGGVLSTLLTHPLAKAQRLAAQVAGGDYDLRLPESGPSELAELAHHLNEMAEELQKQRRGRELVLSNMTHEMARSLGGLRLGVDSLKGGALEDPALAADLLVEMGQTLQRMEALIEDLALAARPVAKPIYLNLAPVPLEPMLHGLRSRFLPRAELRGVNLEVRLTREMPLVEADELRLQQILANLLDNAIKFTPPGGRVTLSAEHVGDTVRLTVQDTGPGIPPKDLKRMLEPFTQGEANPRIQQGMGLGLAIVQQLTTAHGGHFELTNAAEGGLLAAVILPVLQPQSDGK